ncbi:MAG: cation-translocating P-type ATPase [Bacteriovorax sp.]
MGGNLEEQSTLLIKSPWSKEVDAVLKELETSFERGLTSAETAIRQSECGPNSLKIEKKMGSLQRLFNQLKSPVIFILLIATIISIVLGDVADSIAIVTIVIINAGIGFIQETRAEAAVEALKKLSAPKARVLREGGIVEILASEVTIGDVLVLEAGDYVSADARILRANQLSADEMILTGESLPVGKISSPLPSLSILADRKNMLFAGTAISTGSGRAVAVAIGMHSEIGKIADMLESAENVKTPLQIHLEQVSNKLLVFCAAVVFMVSILGLIHGERWINVIMSAIGLSVAAIPEGLPTIVTLALSLATHRMAKRNAIVRHLPAVETLGSTNVICTDKTGTLTTGKMRVRETFTLESGTVNESTHSNDSIKSLLESAVLCCNAALSDDGSSTGDPTEIALLYAGKNHHIEYRQLFASSPRLAEWSFDSDRKRMSVAVKSNDGVRLHVKGAPESTLPLCTLSEEELRKINVALEELSSQGRRLLAVATKKLLASSKEFDHDKFKESSSVEKDLHFLGLISIADPPREESIKAIGQCKAAGIIVVMITGDHPSTARAIARELGIIKEGEFDQVLTGLELEQLSQAEFLKRVEKIAVYARVTPEDKLRIVEAWQRLGHVVAMTGDGVNDAPALKRASIGVSMGKGGTEVAKQASSIILTDDNFSTIVSAIEEGRAIYGNIRRTIQYLLSGNLSEILIMLGAAILGLPAPLAPVHLLWINLVTDGLPSLALAAEPVPKNVLALTKGPSPQGFFDQSFYKEMAFVGTITSVFTLALYTYCLKFENELIARTYAFSFLVFAELFRSFASRSEQKTFFEMGVRSNIYHLIAVIAPIVFQISLLHIEFFRGIFKVEALNWMECLALIILALIPASMIELKKLRDQH